MDRHFWCDKHRREFNKWIDATGPAAEPRHRYSNATVRDQCELIARACKERIKCSDDPGDAFT